MDHSQFDDITRSFAAPSRRSLLHIAGGTALAAWFGLDAREADAKPKKKKCKKPKAKCGKACVNLKTDEKNCGSCGKTCAAGQTCSNGNCVGGSCDPSENFGYCCPPGRPNCASDFGNEHYKRCTLGGTCQCPAALPHECVKNPLAPDLVCWTCCTDEDCPEGAGARSQCTGLGDCVCPAGEMLCRGRCTDPTSDKQNCSAIAGDCGFACPAGDDWECCDGTCAFLPGCLNGSRMSDCQKPYCGTCENACLGEGSACCEGSCVASDELNCVFCGNRCTLDLPVCCGGGIFGVGCTDPDRDPFNCGECGNVCDGGEACCHGECTPLGTPDNCRSCDDECESGQCVSSGAGCA